LKASKCESNKTNFGGDTAENPLIFPSKTKMRLRRVRYDEIFGVEVGARSFLDKKYFESSVTMTKFGALGKDISG